MKMAVSKYRLFIMFLTTYYIFDSVFAVKDKGSPAGILCN